MHFGHAPFRCENCGRYYLSAAARLTRYCDGTAPQDARYTCRQYGALMRQKEKNRDHPVYALFKTRANTIRKHHERGKISDALRTAAISQAETCRDKALFDSAYASAGYEADMELDEPLRGGGTEDGRWISAAPNTATAFPACV
jgi:hypothetical protein